MWHLSEQNTAKEHLSSTLYKFLKINGGILRMMLKYLISLLGNFSFGSLTKFKSNTIVDFIENAVEHSRSGRYLFFLHRRPERGPMRVQLLNPVSRLKQIRSLQHMCRLVFIVRISLNVSTISIFH